MPFFVYLLMSQRRTYVGATVDLDHRLRQHNGELVGGAKATKRQVDKGESWVRVAHVEGFPTWQSALQFEWKWKQITRKSSPMKNGLKRRLLALQKLLSLPRSTTRAIPFVEWEVHPTATMETSESSELWSQLTDA